MAKIELPSNWTKQDVEGFLKFIKPDAEDKLERDGLKVERPKHHCWRDGGCLFWVQDGQKEYQGHCGLESCECLTAVFNHRNPTRWLPPKLIEEIS